MKSIFSIFASEDKSPKALHLKSLREALFSEFNGKFTQTKWSDTDAENNPKVPVNSSTKIVKVSHDDQLKAISIFRENANVDRVIDILKETQENAPHERGPFHALDIGWKSTSSQKFSRHTGAALLCPWTGTANLLKKAPTDDAALNIFCALAKSIEPDQAGARTELMHIALSSPTWARQAIEIRPEIFANQSVKIYQMQRKSLKNSGWTSNAYVVMASIPLLKASVKDCQEILQALDKVGVRRPVGPEGMTVLHLAAAKQTPACMRAFVHHFPGDKNSRNRLGETPDHVAARDGSPETLAVLMESRILDRPDGSLPSAALTHLGDSPLDEAVKAKRIDCVRVICGSSELSSCELLRARSWAAGEELKAFLNAQIARQAIEEEFKELLNGLPGNMSPV